MRIVDRLTRHGHEAFLVGGCVRDLLRRCEPDDYDIATSARPEQVIALFPRTVAVGAKFGVVLVVDDGAQAEVAAYRCESGYLDHRHPQIVEFSDARHDALRRDFTINGLFMNPSSGEVFDFVGGRADIETNIIRAIGDPRERFTEDALRLLRALRFSSSLEYDIEPGTWNALRALSHTITEISAERVRDEIIKGFTRPHPGKFLDLLDRSGLLGILLPEAAATKGCRQPPEFHPEGDVYEHTKLMLAALPPDPSPALALAALLHDAGKPATMQLADRIRFNNHHKAGAEMVEHIGRRLAFPNELRERVKAMVLRHMDFINLTSMRKSTLRRFLAAPAIEEDIELHRADCLASHGDTSNCDYALRHLAEMRAESPEGKLPRPLVNGRDLIDMGLEPGPRFRVLLRAVQDAQLEGSVSGREQALAMLKSLALKPESPS